MAPWGAHSTYQNTDTFIMDTLMWFMQTPNLVYPEREFNSTDLNTGKLIYSWLWANWYAQASSGFQGGGPAAAIDATDPAHMKYYAILYHNQAWYIPDEDYDLKPDPIYRDLASP
jgi:hypothetical protein